MHQTPAQATLCYYKDCQRYYTLHTTRSSSSSKNPRQKPQTCTLPGIWCGHFEQPSEVEIPRNNQCCAGVNGWWRNHQKWWLIVKIFSAIHHNQYSILLVSFMMKEDVHNYHWDTYLTLVGRICISLYTWTSNESLWKKGRPKYFAKSLTAQNAFCLVSIISYSAVNRKWGLLSHDLQEI